MTARVRLSKQQEFALLYRKGGSVAAPTLTLRYLKSNFPYSRLGVVVSKKISKKAAVRNRLRRQITGWWLTHQSLIKPGYDVVCVIKRDQEATPEQVETAFAKAGIVGGTDA